MVLGNYTHCSVPNVASAVATVVTKIRHLICGCINVLVSILWGTFYVESSVVVGLARIQWYEQMG